MDNIQSVMLADVTFERDRLKATNIKLVAALSPFAIIDIDAALKAIMGGGFVLLVQDARAALAKAEGE